MPVFTDGLGCFGRKELEVGNKKGLAVDNS